MKIWKQTKEKFVNFKVCKNENSWKFKRKLMKPRKNLKIGIVAKLVKWQK